MRAKKRSAHSVEHPAFRDHVTQRKGRWAQKIDFARRERDLTTREAGLGERETTVTKRAAKAD